LIAFDTNILVYALEDNADDVRHITSVNLIGKAGLIGALIPFPVIGELFNVCRKKKIIDVAELTPRIQLWMQAFAGAPAIFEDYMSAAVLSKHSNLQYFDALIIAVAARAGATILLSEDMHDGLKVGGLRVVNPFAAGNDGVITGALGV
jgi:predicted nucleic acid-binding protein